MEHSLKILPEYFAAVKDGKKTFELRKDDRGYAAGDTLVLMEWTTDLQAYTGRLISREVTYVLRDAEQFGLAPGYCILGIK